MTAEERDAAASAGPAPGTSGSSPQGGDDEALDYTEQLPDVFVLSILALLDAASLVNCQSVCKRWLRLGREQVLWRRLGQENAEFSTALAAVRRVGGAEPSDWLAWCALRGSAAFPRRTHAQARHRAQSECPRNMRQAGNERGDFSHRARRQPSFLLIRWQVQEAVRRGAAVEERGAGERHHARRPRGDRLRRLHHPGLPQPPRLWRRGRHPAPLEHSHVARRLRRAVQQPLGAPALRPPRPASRAATPALPEGSLGGQPRSWRLRGAHH